MAAGPRPLVEASPLPDAILLDLIMPRLDGQRLTRFSNRTSSTRASRGHPHRDRHRGRGQDSRFGADAYIAKGRHRRHLRALRATFRWLEERTDPHQSATKSSDREASTRGDDARAAPHQGAPRHHALHDGRGVVEIDQDQRILYANPPPADCSASRTQALRKPCRSSSRPPHRWRASYSSVSCGADSATPEPLMIPTRAGSCGVTFSALADPGTTAARS